MTSHEGLGPIMKQQVILTLFKKKYKHWEITDFRKKIR